MQQCILDLIHPSRYQVGMQSYHKTHGANADIAYAQKLLTQAENEIAAITQNPKATIHVTDDALDAACDYVRRILTIPQQRGQFESAKNLHTKSGIDYIWQWSHEHCHHEQSDRQNPNINFKMAQISRALYYRPPNYPKWFRNLFQPKMDARYATNYNELLAHAASARCLTQAYTELRQRHDFTVEDRDTLLPSYEQRVRELTEYLSHTSALTITEFNNAQLKYYKPDEIVCMEMTCSDVQQFLRQNGSKIYLQAIAELQRATRDLARVVKEMQLETGERREETREYQHELELQYQYKQKATPIQQTPTDKVCEQPMTEYNELAEHKPPEQMLDTEERDDL